MLSFEEAAASLKKLLVQLHQLAVLSALTTQKSGGGFPSGFEGHAAISKEKDQEYKKSGFCWCTLFIWHPLLL